MTLLYSHYYALHVYYLLLVLTLCIDFIAMKSTNYAIFLV